MIKASLFVSIGSLKNNPLRSFLTISGIVIGIAAVVAVLSIGKGHKEKIESQIQEMGTNLFWVNVKPLLFGNFFRKDGFSQSRGQNSFQPNSQSFLTYSDAAKIQRRCTAVQWTAPVITFYANGTVNGKPVQFNVIATSPQYIKVKSLDVLKGRFLADQDLRQFKDVCIIEERSTLRLNWQEKNYILLNSKRFKIIGQVTSDNFRPASMNAIIIYLPITTAQLKLLGSDKVHSIYCVAKDKLLDIAKQQVLTILSSQSLGTTNYEILSSRDLFNTSEKLTRTATMVTAGIGMISLFVGGIGIMNILLASVFERIREIGIRRAVGAGKRDILFQFLFESVVFSFLGGIIGIIVSFFVTKLVSTAIKIPAIFSFEGAVTGLIFSLMIGLVFGIYPAWKAANLDPIEALRYE